MTARFRPEWFTDFVALVIIAGSVLVLYGIR